MKQAFLTSVLLLTLFTAASCSQKADNASVTAAQTTAGTESQQSTEYSLPVVDFEGYILNAGTANDCYWANTIFDIQEEVGEIVNDAIYNRNRIIEERYNILIREVGYANYDHITNTIEKDYNADLHTFDIAFPPGRDLNKLIAKGLATNLNEVPYLDFDNPWWDSGSVKDLSVGGKVYGVTGDIHYMSFDATWILTFNKKMIEDYNLESPYELIKQNEWTFEVFTDMMKVVTADIDGNGVMNKEDRYGFTTHSSSYLGLYIASGERYFGKDKNDMPTLIPLNDRMNAVYEHILRIMHDGKATYDAYNVKDNGTWAYEEMYVADRALFFAEVLGEFNIPLLRNMSSDYGIIPWPKFDLEQESYHNLVHPEGALMVIPTGVENKERVGLLAEALAYESYKTVRPAFYDTALRLKSSRDEESFEMLNLIFDNRVYELGMIYNWGNLCNEFQEMGKKNKNELASLYAKKEEKINSDIASFIDSISVE